jgi:predicted P-loop ATPase
MLKENRHSDVDLIRKVFNCLKINDEYAENVNYYATLFVKWCINVVKMANNTLENDYSGQGVLVLQGEQGCFKSTFCRKLMPKKEWFKGDISLDTTSKDSIIQNTNYVLVEWGELDSTMKNEQAKLKQFITSTNDEYRASYARLAEKHPRRTSYIGTVNKVDFLKDETGSRRFWIIPILGCDLEELEHINMAEFWGAVYDLWLSKNIEDYLLPEELKKLNSINKSYNFKNDVSITLEEKINWDMDKQYWEVYTISEIADKLYIKERKTIKNELEKMGLKYQSHRGNTGKVKKGFRLPVIQKEIYF